MSDVAAYRVFVWVCVLFRVQGGMWTQCVCCFECREVCGLSVCVVSSAGRYVDSVNLQNARCNNKENII